MNGYGKSYTSILLRQTFRAGAEVKSKTLAAMLALKIWRHLEKAWKFR